MNSHQFSVALFFVMFIYSGFNKFLTLRIRWLRWPKDGTATPDKSVRYARRHFTGNNRLHHHHSLLFQVRLCQFWYSNLCQLPVSAVPDSGDLLVSSAMAGSDPFSIERHHICRSPLPSHPVAGEICEMLKYYNIIINWNKNLWYLIW